MKPIYNQFWNESYHKECNFDKNTVSRSSIT